MIRLDFKLYKLARKIFVFLMKFVYKAEYIHKENIPKEGPFLLAGNHKNNLDCVILMSSTDKSISFLAKVELMRKYGFLFKHLGIIPVDRSTKNKEAVNESIDILNNNGVVGIFPEGTFNNTEYIIRPFKMGTVKIASLSSVPIVPFAIINDYKMFRKSVKIVFGKPYYVKDKNDLVKENIVLMNKIVNLLKGEYDEK